MNDVLDAGVAASTDRNSARVAAETNVEASPSVDPAPMHFGAQLAAKRHALGLSQGEIAERLRLHPRQIVAIEAADLAALPGLTFVLGYVRNYARSLGIDAEPLLANLRERTGLRPPADVLRGHTSAEDAFTPSSTVDTGPAPRGPASRQVVLASVIGGLIILAIVGVVASRKPVTPTAAVAVAPATPTPAAPVTSGDAAGGAAASRAPEQQSAPPAASEAPPSLVKAAKADEPTPAVPAATLRMNFRERSWVELTQGDGRVLLSQVIEAGTEQRIAGRPPYRMVIGNASTVSVEWRGRAVDLKPLTNFDNVARVTLE